MSKSKKVKDKNTLVKQPEKSPIHLDILDGYRAIAILIVVWFHVWEQSWLYNNFKILGFQLKLDNIARAGFMGVDLFFFISGFCLFYPFARTMLEKNAMPSWKHFYYRRFIKIVPSYYLQLALILLLFPMKGDFVIQAKNLLSHLFFVNSWFQDNPMLNQFNGVLWSLSVEVQFYIIFPLICLAMMKKPFLTTGSLVIFAIIYRNNIMVTQASKFGIYLHQLPGVIDIFVVGMFCAYLVVMLRNKAPRINEYKVLFSILSVISFCALFWLIGTYIKSGVSKDIWIVNTRPYFVLAFLLCIITGCFAYRILIKIVANKIFMFFSIISYNLYLWHQLIAMKMKYVWKFPYSASLEPYKDDKVWQSKYTIYAWIISIAFSALITYVFERPILKNGFKGIFKKFIKQKKL